MKGWTDLKDAFFAAVDASPEERARQIAALRSADPALADRLEALLAADGRGELLTHIFHVDDAPPDRPERIGTFQVTGVLGVGGMGEVYRAHDTKLHRDVAIKVLPASLANDRDRLARFEREAHVLASLNHRHIAHVYGLDESGGRPAIVMELVPGPTLAMVIASQPGASIALSRVLAIARQIADGLDAAHEKGIIHRDLKPGNVALTEDGDVKILDFGVAKTLGPGPNLPGAAAATDIGAVIGTPAYMSPEQARGLTVDKRADIWAFGCLLYELLTGRQAFGGNTTSDSLAAVLEREPDMTFVPARTPAAVRSLLRHCLEKDPKHRLRDIADARRAIDDAVSQPVQEQENRRASRGWMFWLLAGTAAVAGVAIVLLVLQAGRPVDLPGRTVASIVLPVGMRLSGPELEAQAPESTFAISPDGRKLALVAVTDTARTQLWLRDLGSAALQPLPGTDNASFPFWSPDSGSIGFVASGKLKTIRLSDGNVMTVSDSGFRGGTWSRDNVIVFAPARASPLHAVPASGGTPSPVTTLDRATGEVQHGYPSFLPDGRHFLYFRIGTLTGGAIDPRGIYLGSLDGTGPAKPLVPGATHARYVNDHLLFVQGGVLMAQAFDVESRQVRGAPQQVVEDVRLSTAGATPAMSAFSVSDNGVLLYQASLKIESRLVWLDRTGKQAGTLTPPADYGDVAFSPDGSRLAVSVTDPSSSTRDLWLYDVASGRGQRLTVDPVDEYAPVWSPDGSRLLFSSSTKGVVNLNLISAGGSGGARRLDADKQGLGRFAADWSRDGFLMYIGGGRAILRSDLWVAPVVAPQDARALLESSFVETHGRFAPRGPWFAYSSNETGRLEVYIDRFPELGAKRPVSTNGGGWPRWSNDGTELFYISPDNQLMAVAVAATPLRLDVGVPQPLFRFKPRVPVRLDAYSFDVSPNRQRFVVNEVVEDPAPTVITLVINWPDRLTKK